MGGAVMDWQKILKCYIEHIFRTEGTTFIRSQGNQNDLMAPDFYQERLTEYEYAALRAVAEEIET